MLAMNLGGIGMGPVSTWCVHAHSHSDHCLHTVALFAHCSHHSRSERHHRQRLLQDLFRKEGQVAHAEAEVINFTLQPLVVLTMCATTKEKFQLTAPKHSGAVSASRPSPL